MSPLSMAFFPIKVFHYRLYSHWVFLLDSLSLIKGWPLLVCWEFSSLKWIVLAPKFHNVILKSWRIYFHLFWVKMKKQMRTVMQEAKEESSLWRLILMKLRLSNCKINEVTFDLFLETKMNKNKLFSPSLLNWIYFNH